MKWKNPPPPKVFWHFFSKRYGIFRPNFTYLLYVSVYARLQIFIELSAILTKLCHIKRDHPVYTICSKCPPSAEMHAGIFWRFCKTVEIFSPSITHLLLDPIYARLQIYIQLSPTVTKLCHIATTQHAFQTMVDIWWSHLVWHTFATVGGN